MVVPAAGRDVEVLVVEEHPDLGLLCCRLALVRLLLDEIAGRQNRAVHLFVQATVDLQGLAHPRGPHRRKTTLGARDDSGRLGRRRNDRLHSTAARCGNRWRGGRRHLRRPRWLARPGVRRQQPHPESRREYRCSLECYTGKGKGGEGTLRAYCT